jgi:cob(I)alamin adenosyltransferase
MGNRLSKIYTRTGDDGETGLGDGTRVRKDDPRVEAYGTVDELNSAIGVVLERQDIPETVRECLTGVQHELFDLGGELCMPGHHAIEAGHVEALESAHLARAVCRRAERRVWTLAASEDVNPAVSRYLNRLSDLLFVVARVLARRDGGTEVLWDHRR